MENVADWFATDLRMSACAAAHLRHQHIPKVTVCFRTLRADVKRPATRVRSHPTWCNFHSILGSMRCLATILLMTDEQLHRTCLSQRTFGYASSGVQFVAKIHRPIRVGLHVDDCTWGL